MKTLNVKTSAAGKKPAATKASPAKAGKPPAKKAAPARANKPLLRVVSATAVGGFQVFGTLVSPKHVTPQQIAEAVAGVD